MDMTVLQVKCTDLEDSSRKRLLAIVMNKFFFSESMKRMTEVLRKASCASQTCHPQAQTLPYMHCQEWNEEYGINPNVAL